MRANVEQSDVNEGFLGEFKIVKAKVASDPGPSRLLTLLCADREDLLAKGLSRVNDPTLRGCHGMLFVFPVDVERKFWMGDTIMPLSLAFISAGGVVEATVDMEPYVGDDCRVYSPPGPYRYALEMAQGRFRELGISVGAVLNLVDDEAEDILQS